MLDTVLPDTVDELIAKFEEHQYLAGKGIATAVFLALKLEKPLLLEGIAGCGKTEIARTLAPLLGSDLIRLQCYEGIDTHEALYEWDYTRQLLHLRAAQDNKSTDIIECELYSEQFLLERPLLKALRQNKRPVLLLDELDRADADFEAFLLEFLEEFQVTIPEIGTVKAVHKPIVIITSNRTRDLHDALKRRCIYHWVDLPSQENEEKIIRLRMPSIDEDLSKLVALAVSRLRNMDLSKKPGTSESIDWARALTLLSAGKNPSIEDFEATLSVVVKDHSDHELVSRNFEQLFNVN